MIRLLHNGNDVTDKAGCLVSYQHLSEALYAAYLTSLMLNYADIQVAEENSFRGGLDILATVTCNRIERIKG